SGSSPAQCALRDGQVRGFLRGEDPSCCLTMNVTGGGGALPDTGGSVATREVQRRGRASVVGGAGRVTASTRPRMQAAQPVSHSSQKMPESPGTSAKTNPSPPQTNSPTTILVFHFFPMTGLSLMR